MERWFSPGQCDLFLILTNVQIYVVCVRDTGGIVAVLGPGHTIALCRTFSVILFLPGILRLQSLGCWCHLIKSSGVGWS